ncbi:MAG: hypothetical protein HYY43_04605 [Deltaproteobacteria bacterium]|nr:hypothetical protein [Deltaproteobacteria bacterium]MBI2974851.1 hypothetical protein [Deltaproteobacteria bacterium]
MTEALFRLTGEILEEKGYIVKKGTIVDATIIAASSSTKNESGKRDEEMRSTNKHDKTEMEALLHGEEKAVFGDKGYYDEREKRKARKAGIFGG